MNSDAPIGQLPAPVQQRIRRYRIAAMIILLTGVVAAATVYWIGSRREVDLDDPSMIGFNKAQERQMEILYGKQGDLIESAANALKEPGTQAVLIVMAAALIAGGCFQFSRMIEWEAKEGQQ